MLYDVVPEAGENRNEVNTRRAVAETRRSTRSASQKRLPRIQTGTSSAASSCAWENEAYTAAENTWHYAQQIQVFLAGEVMAAEPRRVRSGAGSATSGVCAGEESIYNSLKFQTEGAQERRAERH